MPFGPIAITSGRHSPVALVDVHVPVDRVARGQTVEGSMVERRERQSPSAGRSLDDQPLEAALGVVGPDVESAFGSLDDHELGLPADGVVELLAAACRFGGQAGRRIGPAR